MSDGTKTKPLWGCWQPGTQCASLNLPRILRQQPGSAPGSGGHVASLSPGFLCSLRSPPTRGMTGLSPTPSRTRDPRRRWAALPAGCGHLVLTSPVGTWEEGPSFPQSPVGQSFKSPREATGKRGVWVLSRVRRRGLSLLLSTMGTHACPGIPRAS